MTDWTKGGEAPWKEVYDLMGALSRRAPFFLAHPRALVGPSTPYLAPPNAHTSHWERHECVSLVLFVFNAHDGW